MRRIGLYSAANEWRKTWSPEIEFHRPNPLRAAHRRLGQGPPPLRKIFGVERPAGGQCANRVPVLPSRQNRDALAVPVGQAFSLSHQPDALFAKIRQPSKASPKGCAMILASLSWSAEGRFPHRRATRSTFMMAACRFPRPFRVILFFVVALGVPNSASPAGLEEPAKEFARRIAAALPPGETSSCEVRNISSLRPAESAQIEGWLKAELEERGVRLAAGDASIKVLVTLSENFNALVWTGEIRQGGASHVIMASVDHSTEKTSPSRTMPVAMRSEKFWEGPERILDAGEISNGFGKSRLVLLLPIGVSIRDPQSGSVNTIEIASSQSASRDPWGNLNVDAGGDLLGVFLAPRACTIDLERPDSNGCTPRDAREGSPISGRAAIMIDIAPSGSPPPGKGTVIEMQSVCGGGTQFLATGARDYTQTDSVQVFEMEPGGAVAVSGELDFPGPITALHATSTTPRVVVRNLATGNYEAYRLSFSCAQ